MAIRSALVSLLITPPNPPNSPPPAPAIPPPTLLIALPANPPSLAIPLSGIPKNHFKENLVAATITPVQNNGFTRFNKPLIKVPNIPFLSFGFLFLFKLNNGPSTLSVSLAVLALSANFLRFSSRAVSLIARSRANLSCLALCSLSCFSFNFFLASSCLALSSAVLPYILSKIVLILASILVVLAAVTSSGVSVPN